MPHPRQRVARSLTRFGRPPAITKPLKRNWRTRSQSRTLENHYHATVQDNAINPYARFRHNPPVGGSQLGKKPPPPDTPENVIRLEKIVLHSFMKQAIGSRSNLLGPIMAFRALSGETDKGAGKHAVTGVQIVHGKKSVGGWIRPNIPVGVKVELKGAPMYDFMGQLVEFHWLPPQAMAFFPQIEVNVDAYPKPYGMHIHFVTNATGVGAENRARALLSGFQLPFTRR
ncbi:ribosomal protein L5 domain-containing protein [Mycena leptocephala]|nr:ribosomal protein L5 domain-containing protein [Mycena leptocephala]